jgi:hypothetical protein
MSKLYDNILMSFVSGVAYTSAFILTMRFFKIVGFFNENNIEERQETEEDIESDDSESTVI